MAAGRTPRTTPPPPSSPSSTAPTDEPTAETSEATEPTEDVQEYDDGGQVDPDKFVARLQDGIAKTKYAHIEFTMGGAGGEMTGSGDVDYTATPPNMQMSMELGPQSVGMLLVEKIMYVQSSRPAASTSSSTSTTRRTPSARDSPSSSTPPARSRPSRRRSRR